MNNIKIDKDKKYLVCLIDVMGQSQLFHEISNLNDKRIYNEKEFTENDIISLEQKIRQAEVISDHIILLKNRLTSEFELMRNKGKLRESVRFFEGMIGQKIESLDEITDNMHSVISALKFNIQQFSDTIIMYTEMPIDVMPIAIIVSSWYYILSKTMVFSFAKGISLRGTISYDLGWELGENNLYGPALSTVHYLESECTQHPRIILSDQFVSLINFCKAIIKKDCPIYNEEDFFNVHVDVDGAFVLDYLAPRLATYYKRRPDLFSKRELLEAYNFIQDRMLTYRGAKDLKDKNQKLALYYSLVNAYFTSKIAYNPEWQMEIKYDAKIPKYVMTELE